MRNALVCGAGGFIGSHLVNRLKKEEFWVRGVDLKYPEFSETQADDFVIGDLRDPQVCRSVVDRNFDEVYQLAADMGGAAYVFTGDNDANVMHNSALINLNMLTACHERKAKRIFYSSSACMYPEYNQLDPDNPKTAEDSAYPAQPDSEYGWESYSANAYISRSIAIMAPRCGLPDTTTFSAPRARGPAAARKHQPHCAVRWRNPWTEGRSKSGETVSKRARSSTLTNASKDHCD